MIPGLEQIQCHTTLIADGTPAGGILEGELSIDGTAATQIEDVVRSVSPVGFDRENQRCELKFTVSYQFTSRIAALDTRLRSRQNIPRQGALILSLTDDGATIYTATSLGALWHTVTPTQDGATTLITYQVTALNPFSVVNAAVPATLIDGGTAGNAQTLSLDGGNAADGSGDALTIIDGGNP